MQRIEQRNIGQEQAITQTEGLMEKKVNLKKQSQSIGSEFIVRSSSKGSLKKQSQFVPGLMGVTPFMKGAYDDNSPGGDVKNKANQSQLKARIGFRPESLNVPGIIPGGRL